MKRYLSLLVIGVAIAVIWTVRQERQITDRKVAKPEMASSPSPLPKIPATLAIAEGTTRTDFSAAEQAYQRTVDSIAFSQEIIENLPYEAPIDSLREQ